MPIWAYSIPPWLLALIMVAGFVTLSLAGLIIIRRYIVPRIHYHDGVNDAISGSVQAIGVFYGITVGLIAVAVWNSHSNAEDLTSMEAAQIAGLYRDASAFPEPLRTPLKASIYNYTVTVIEKEWPAQRKGMIPNDGISFLNDFQDTLMTFEPLTKGQEVLLSESLRAFNQLIQCRRMRLAAVGGKLSSIMWFVIWIGAAISIAIGYLFYIEDFRLHAALIGMMGAFLGIVVFIIAANDRPFTGGMGLTPDAYQLLLDTVRNLPK
ncbi:MAG: hypothetical protein RDV48_05720 [Candidatus Eremiobacteraeota bacterium]|nr:hypothetical protein [Candidatus Eremiobacteraeota bacterium]